MLRPDLENDLAATEFSYEIRKEPVVETITQLTDELEPENRNDLVDLMEKYPDQIHAILESVIDNADLFTRIFTHADDVLYLRFTKVYNVEENIIEKILSGCSPEQLDRLIASDHEGDLLFYHAEKIRALNIINPAIRQGKEAILALKDSNLLNGVDLKAFISCLKNKLGFSSSYSNNDELYLALRSLKIVIEKMEVKNTTLQTLCVEAIQTSGFFSTKSKPPYNLNTLPAGIKEKFEDELKFEFTQ